MDPARAPEQALDEGPRMDDNQLDVRTAACGSKFPHAKEEVVVNDVLDSLLSKKLGIRCFNQTWELIDSPKRSPEGDLDMITLAHASLWFWKHHEGHTPTNLSIGYWQLSRVYALVGDGMMAARFGQACVDVSDDASVDTFYLAYGYEALARACTLLGQTEAASRHIERARHVLIRSKETETDALLTDLKGLEAG